MVHLLKLQLVPSRGNYASSGAKIIDLNVEPTANYFVSNSSDNKPQRIRIVEKYLNMDLYIISAGKMKTHNCVLVTMSLKNLLMGAPVNDYKTQNDKMLMHSWNLRDYKPGMKITMTKDLIPHYNLFQLTQIVYPDLGVVDAFTAMEGNGPIEGTPVDSRLALASVDPLALDTAGTKIMGLDPTQIHYMSSMNEAGLGQGDLDKIKVVGADLNDYMHKFKPNELMIEPYGLN